MKKMKVWNLIFRINAMVEAMHQVDISGVFGTGDPRLNLLINVEVMPPDETNVIQCQKTKS